MERATSLLARGALLTCTDEGSSYSGERSHLQVKEKCYSLMDDLQRNKTRVFWTRRWLKSVHYKAVSEKNAGAKLCEQKVVKRRVNASFYVLHASDPPCIVAWLLPPGPSFFPKLFIHQTDSGPLSRFPLKLGSACKEGEENNNQEVF